MADFSIGKAFDGGFTLATKKPLTVLIWGLLRLALTLLPALLILSMAAPAFMAAARQAGETTDPKAAQELFSSIWAIQAIQPVLYLGGIVSVALIGAAALRALFEPEDDSRFYLRLGARELWFGLVYVVLMILLTMLALAAFLLLALVAGVTAAVIATTRGHLAFEPWMIPLILAACVALGVATLWVWLRLSMALPMTFRDRTFRLFESWSLTRGHAWRLFLLGLLLLLVFLGIEIAAVVAVGAFASVLALAGAAAMGFDTLSQRSFGDWAWVIVLVAAAAIPVFAYLGGFAYALFLGGWGSAFRQLTAEPQSAAAQTG